MGDVSFSQSPSFLADNFPQTSTRPYESRQISFSFLRQIRVKHSPLCRMMVPHVVEKGELLARSAKPVFKWIEHRSSFNC